ncbi:ankyrin repeat-containing domain protein [Leptodontidium sp. 2 PMI_412]|nr:ankyrin repeat-containing domain protein [Leptodontidium sp. MPI-SDFR-AT-0119]KAH9205352.1 ankyrin repeat-containing domain protein [Leptodontidium sp. 2 PMI_412]
MPAQAAALQGNNEALELVLKSDRRSNNVWAGKGAVANGHFSTLDLLLEPKWELKQMTNYYLNKSVLRGLMENNSIAMFTRAFPLISDYEPDPRCPGSPIGHFLKCAVERGYVMLALHLIRLGAPLTGYCSFTSGEDNPLWSACKSGSEHSVRLLLRKGVSPNTDPDMPYSCPLQVAASRGHLGVVRTLLRFGADVDRASKDGPPPIVYAIRLEHGTMFQLLKEVRILHRRV